MFPFGFSKLFDTLQVDWKGIPEIQVGNSYMDNSKRLCYPFKQVTQPQINTDASICHASKHWLADVGSVRIAAEQAA